VDTVKTETLADLRSAINAELMSFVSSENKYLESIGSELIPVAKAMQNFLLDSGKRLRPVFAYVGFLGSSNPISTPILKACASLELIHVCALMHDDVMDGSDTRRGAPAVHRAFEAMHKEIGLKGSAEQFGISAAILLGDLALVWSAKALHNAGLSDEELIRALAMYDEMRVELMAGQYLDIYEQALGSQSVERSLKVARYKSGKYTIERPLHFGAALGSADPKPLYEIYSNYGLPLGEAFQLRDDVLGIFGDPSQTGKPAGDDLREGKRTVLLAMTLDLINESEKNLIEGSLGNSGLSSEKVNQIREIIKNSGALAEVEKLIESLTNKALTSIDSPLLSKQAQGFLSELAIMVTKRSA